MIRTSFSMALGLFLFGLGSQAKADIAESGVCTTPVKIGRADSDYSARVYNNNGVSRIYVYRNFQPRNTAAFVEISPGIDGTFGTPDDQERVVPEKVDEVSGNIAITRPFRSNSYWPSASAIIRKAGSDNLLFTADDTTINLGYAVPVTQVHTKDIIQGDMLIYRDATGGISVCDHTINAGAGSCANGAWPVPRCTSALGCLFPYDYLGASVFKQKINGIFEPIVLMMDGVNFKYAVYMLNYGVSFPINVPLKPTYGLLMHDIEGTTLFYDDYDLNTNERVMGSVNLDYNSSSFLAGKEHQRTNFLGYLRVVSNGAPQGSNMPPYIFHDGNSYGFKYRDDARNITRQITDSPGFIFEPQSMNQNLIVGQGVSPSTNSFFVAVTSCD